MSSCLRTKNIKLKENVSTMLMGTYSKLIGPHNSFPRELVETPTAWNI